MLSRPQKITFAEMRASGVRGLLVYCSDYHCSHWTAISGDRWPDDVRLASERLGHSKVGITLDLYSHVIPGMQEDAAAMVDAP
jgi:hypothetical protein